ncbi:LA2681 family HEPN domain-containing protein [Pseudoxanthomonas mexicana]
MFNELKQLFCSARWLLWEGLYTNRPHFSDRGVVLLNTLGVAELFSPDMNSRIEGFRWSKKIVEVDGIRRTRVGYRIDAPRRGYNPQVALDQQCRCTLGQH